MGYVPSGFTVVFLTPAGEVFFVAVEAEFPVDFTGVGPVVFLSALTALDAEAGVEVVFFLTAVGSGFFVPAVAGFELSLTVVLAAVTGVFLTEDVAGVGLDAEALDTGFLVADDVAGVEVLAGVVVDVEPPAELSFLGAFLTGVVVASVVVEVEAAGFLTGVALVVEEVVFAGEAVVGFFAVDSAVFAMFPTLARRIFQ